MKFPIYEELQDAFSFYNEKLFDGRLPRCIITLNNKNNSFGYFSPNHFVKSRDDKVSMHEISMNSSYFNIRNIELTLATLVHEMVHCSTYEDDTYGRGAYHNRHWASLMKSVGLYPSSTGEQGGKETGDHVSHYIVPDGLFDKCTKDFLKNGFFISFVEKLNIDIIRMKISEFEKEVQFFGKGVLKINTSFICGKPVKTAVDEISIIKKKPEIVQSKVKYSCGEHNVWGKPGMDFLYCTLCDKPMEEQF